MNALLAGVLGCALGLGAGMLLAGGSTAVDDRIERYCRLRDRSLGDALVILDSRDDATRGATARHLLAALEHRFAYDELMRCRAFDLARYRGCVATADYACMVEVIRGAREP